MQQIRIDKRGDCAKNRLAETINVGGPAIVWVAGLLLAGSDGPWMPYVNAAGLLMFLGASIWLGQVLPRLDRCRPDSRNKIGPVRTFPRRASLSQRHRTGHSGKLGVI